MSFYLIKTETDYQQALAEIESIFQATPDTPEGDRLEVLTTLVEAYELKHHEWAKGEEALLAVSEF